MAGQRIEPGPGQESVWDYPRPARAEPCSRHIEVWFGGVKVAETRRAWRVLETSHPPVYYIPPEDVLPGTLVPATGSSYCEWKGAARYWTVRAGGREAEKAAWSYDSPTAAFAGIRGSVAFYAASMDCCLVDGQEVTPQPGGFYGGWITADVVGPFKGGPGTWGW
jgi:uncharacterized protein (DUF427 family)